MKKRVLQLIGSFHQGGSERQAIALTRQLKDEGSFDVFAGTLNAEGILEEDMYAMVGPDVPEFPLSSFYNINFARQVRRCSKYLRDNDIDLIQTHDFYTNVFGMAAAAHAGVPARIASKRETTGMRTRAQDAIERLAFNFASAVVVNSDAGKEYLIGRGLHPRKLEVVYNSIDPRPFVNAVPDVVVMCEELGLPAGSSLVTLVANLRHEVKNVPMLLRVAKQVVKVFPTAHFIVAGEGELEATLKERSSEMNVNDNVHFIGRCTDVPRLLSNSEICVLTSKSEGLSNSLLEYMAAAKPVVATRVGAAAEAVEEGKTGYLVEPHDDAGMAARIIELLKNKADRSELGAQGRTRVVEKFSPKSQIDRTTELYKKLLNVR
ncbi:MAG: glycosyltransferase family 4 protein [Pyrinomonadaceae bacterium]